RDDDEVRHGAHQRNVVGGEVRRPVLVARQPRVAADQLDVRLRVGNAGADLLASAEREQRGKRVDKRDRAAQRQPCPDIHHRRLGYTQVEEAIRVPVRKILRQRRRRHVRIEHNYVVVQVTVFSQRHAIRLSLRDLAHTRYPFSSACASANSSSLGTAPCHLAEFSMNETPLPLVVCAITTVGMLWISSAVSSASRICRMLCPLISSTVKPNARHLSTSGSSGMISCAAPSSWTSL